jgi:hypothetical protein
MLSEVAKRKGSDYRASIVKYRGSVIDYEVPIDEDTIATIARSSLYGKAAALKSSRNSNIYFENTSADWPQIKVEGANVESRLRELSNLGIPFQFVSSSSQEMSATARASSD